MKLYQLNIEGFRRIRKAEYRFGDTTFLIGANNVGKSSMFAALDILLSAGSTSLEQHDYHSYIDEDGVQQTAAKEVIIEAEFRDLPSEAVDWQGFKKCLHSYDIETDSGESGLCIKYRKRFPINDKPIVEMLTKKLVLKESFSSAETIDDIVKNELMPEADAKALFGSLSGKLTAAMRKKIDTCELAHDIDTSESLWTQNPGGFQSIVISKLPTFIPVPLDDGRSELQGSNTALSRIMDELFREVREESENFRLAQEHLQNLASELDPQNCMTSFGRMMTELNSVLGGVFDNAKFHAEARLDKPDKFLKPTFSYGMSSNVTTPVNLQGTGMIRSIVFALLKFREEWLASRELTKRKGLIIGFEEPEIYLHPNAANLMRDTIYEVSRSAQIICTTHSPFMVDLSRKERQVLNGLRVMGTGITCTPFTVTKNFADLQGKDKDYVKMLLKIDDYAARIFFADFVVIVEGDTEDIVLRETIDRMPVSVRKTIRLEVQIIKARGKASIIALAKYLKSFGINPFVIHDKDSNEPKAVVFNEPIAEAVGGEQHRIMLCDCMEDVLGYTPPKKDKPFKAYMCCREWGPTWGDVPQLWRKKMEHVFDRYFSRSTPQQVL